MLFRRRHGVMDVSAGEYPVPPRVVGRGAVFVEHRLKIPQVSESAYVAPTAVPAGQLTRRPHPPVPCGAPINAEGGAAETRADTLGVRNPDARDQAHAVAAL